MIDARKHTLDSVKKLTDYSDFNLYKMDICYDYSIDKIIDRGIFDDESALGAILQEVLPDYPVNLKMPNFGCSAFTMKNPDSVMMGRNYDFKNDTSSMLVYCLPTLPTRWRSHARAYPNGRPTPLFPNSTSS